MAGDVVLIASVDWEPLWQSHQEVASRLAASGHRVLFVENTGVRAPGVRDAARLWRRLRDRLRLWRSAGVRQLDAGVWVLSPVVLPPFGGRVARWINRRFALPTISRAAQRLGFRDPIIWTWLPTDTALDLITLLRGPRSLVVYFGIAAFEGLTPHVAQVRACEARLLRCADLVFGHTLELERRYAVWSDRVRSLPPGVDLEAFPLAPLATAAPARPVIGYVGGIHRFLDLDLIAELARRRPGWRWVLVGPVQRTCEELRGLANVELLGACPHAQLAAQISGFDVATIPYVRNWETEMVSPTKLAEYLAVGCPVVSTDLPAVVAFQAEHSVLEVVRHDTDLFLAALERALVSTIDPIARGRRREAAESRSWAAQMGRVEEWLAAVVSERDC